MGRFGRAELWRCHSCQRWRPIDPERWWFLTKRTPTKTYQRRFCSLSCLAEWARRA